MLFDWDEANIKHLARHAVTPAEAEQVLYNDPLDLEVQYINGEHRYRQVGETDSGRVLVITTTWRGHLIRPITGWDATAATKRDYLRMKGEHYGFLP